MGVDTIPAPAGNDLAPFGKQSPYRAYPSTSPDTGDQELAERCTGTLIRS